MPLIFPRNLLSRCAYTKQLEDRYVFNLKEADGFVYRNYILVLHLHSFLHSFHLEAQTVYMVSFPGVKLKLGGGHFDF